jgi:predicted transcriptional regulator
MGDRLFRGMYGDIRRGLIASFVNLTTPEEITEAARNFKIDEELVRNDYEKFYVRTGIAFAKDRVKGFKGGMETKQEDEWVPRIMEYVRANTGKKITEVIKTHYKDIEKVVKESVAEGINGG